MYVCYIFSYFSTSCLNSIQFPLSPNHNAASSFEVNWTRHQIHVSKMASNSGVLFFLPSFPPIWTDGTALLLQSGRQRKKAVMMPRVVLTPLKVNGEHVPSGEDRPPTPPFGFSQSVKCLIKSLYDLQRAWNSFRIIFFPTVENNLLSNSFSNLFIISLFFKKKQNCKFIKWKQQIIF